MPVAGRTRVHAICGAHPSGRYVLGGIAYNMTQRGMQFGLEAMPHIELWRQLPALVKADRVLPAISPGMASRAT